MICETVRLVLPVFFTATPKVVPTPTFSVPKFRLDVDKEIIRVAPPPLPLSGIVKVEFVAVRNVALPDIPPEAVGV